MRYCGYVEKLCPRLVISESVTFTGGNVVIDLPAGAYNNYETYCVIVAQTIPTTATIGAPVVFTIGGGTELYPLTNACCAPVTACGIRTRTKYALKVVTTATGGSFKMLGKPHCAPSNNLTSIDGTAPAAAGGDGA